GWRQQVEADPGADRLMDDPGSVGVHRPEGVYQRVVVLKRQLLGLDLGRDVRHCALVVLGDEVGEAVARFHGEPQARPVVGAPVHRTTTGGFGWSARSRSMALV